MQHENLATALAAFQAELPRLRKDETAKVTGTSKTGGTVNFSYSYAGLDQICETVLPALGKHGLSILSKTTFLDGNFMLIVALLHESGDREEAFWPLPDPRRSGPQEIGSSKTYGRRYLTLALTGTFPGGEDDDGAKAQAQAQQERWEQSKAAKPVSAPPAPPQPTEEQFKNWHALLGKELEIPKARELYNWLVSKDLHERKVPVEGGGGDELTATQVFAFRIADRAAAPDATMEMVEGLSLLAEDAGLLKVPVGDEETLADSLELARTNLLAPSPGA